MHSSSPRSHTLAVPLATVDQLREHIRCKSQLKCRQADDASLEEVRALTGTLAANKRPDAEFPSC